MAVHLTLRTPIGAAGSIANNINGTAIDVIGVPSILTMFGNGEIVGMSHTLNMFVGGRASTPIPTSALPLASTPGAIKKDEDFIARIPVPAGARIVHNITNPGAASNVDFLYILETAQEAGRLAGQGVLGTDLA